MDAYAVKIIETFGAWGIIGIFAYTMLQRMLKQLDTVNTQYQKAIEEHQKFQLSTLELLGKYEENLRNLNSSLRGIQDEIDELRRITEKRGDVECLK